jgi:16S rRNA processing protein RimM
VPLVCVGILQSSFGIHGEAKFTYATDHPEWLKRRKSYLLVDPYSTELLPVTLEQTELRPEHFIAKLDAFDTPEALKPYHAWELLYFARRGELPREEGEVYYFELAGLEVRDTSGAVIGVVSEVVESGAHLLLELSTLPDRFIPFTKQFVTQVDLAAGFLVTNYPLDEFVVEP